MPKGSRRFHGDAGCEAWRHSDTLGAREGQGELADAVLRRGADAAAARAQLPHRAAAAARPPVGAVVVAQALDQPVVPFDPVVVPVRRQHRQQRAVRGLGAGAAGDQAEPFRYAVMAGRDRQSAQAQAAEQQHRGRGLRPDARQLPQPGNCLRDRLIGEKVQIQPAARGLQRPQRLLQGLRLAVGPGGAADQPLDHRRVGVEQVLPAGKAHAQHPVSGHRHLVPGARREQRQHEHLDRIRIQPAWRRAEGGSQGGVDPDQAGGHGVGHAETLEQIRNKRDSKSESTRCLSRLAHHQAVYPPSGPRIAPVKKPEASAARNRAVAAISQGSPQRAIGVISIHWSYHSFLVRPASVMSVAM